jgi:hypothetical protein
MPPECSSEICRLPLADPVKRHRPSEDPAGRDRRHAAGNAVLDVVRGHRAHLRRRSSRANSEVRPGVQGRPGQGRHLLRHGRRHRHLERQQAVLGRHRAPVPTARWPASSPYVVSIDGTQLQDGWTWNPSSNDAFTSTGDFDPAHWAWTNGGRSQAVWDESCAPIATGGGASITYPGPSWQHGVDPGYGNHRLVPDTGWNAAVNGGVVVYITAYRLSTAARPRAAGRSSAVRRRRHHRPRSSRWSAPPARRSVSSR